MSKFRILHVVWNLNVGGIETYVLNLLKAYDRDRFEMDVCCSSGQRGALADEAESLAAKIHLCPLSAGVWTYMARIAQIMRDGRYDAVCDYKGDFAAPAMHAAWRAGVPNRVAFYRSAGWTQRLGFIQAGGARAFRWSMRLFATSILANSRSVMASFHGGVVPGKGKFDVIYNGVDANRFRGDRPDVRARIRAEFNIPADAPVMGHVGGFRPAKNHMRILELAAAARRTNPSTRLLLVGDGELRPQIEARIGELGLRDAVTLAGVRSNTDEMLCAMDIFVFPSFREGFPNAVVEAESCGLPVIGSERPEFHEVIPPGNHDLLAAPDDAAAHERNLLRLLTDESLRRGRGALGPPFVRERFIPEQNRDAFYRHLTRNGLRRLP